MDWFKDSSSINEHRKEIKEARELWKKTYPNEPVNLTKAAVLLTEKKKKDPNYYKLDNKVKMKDVEAKISQTGLPCPKCGANLYFDHMSSCSKVNPNKYSGMFCCSNEECFYHAYTVDGLLDVRNTINDGGFDDLNIVEGHI